MNDDDTRSARLGSILLGLRLTLGLTLGAALVAVGSVWTLGAMALARHGSRRAPTLRTA
ncbi:MAG: hypothetical protein H6719_20650 [Sandaracinaceae bacterium]|nr:hypothetical protein [Sandaracinaceae bacterium]